MSDSIEGIRKKFIHWKDSLESKRLKNQQSKSKTDGKPFER